MCTSGHVHEPRWSGVCRLMTWLYQRVNDWISEAEAGPSPKARVGQKDGKVGPEFIWLAITPVFLIVLWWTDRIELMARKLTCHSYLYQTERGRGNCTLTFIHFFSLEDRIRPQGKRNLWKGWTTYHEIKVNFLSSFSLLQCTHKLVLKILICRGALTHLIPRFLWELTYISRIWF